MVDSILKTDSDKLHSEIDIVALRNQFSKQILENNISRFVTSPVQLLAYEEHRLAGDDETCDCDAFVLGLGEPDNPLITKVGGIPFWPIEKPWPTHSNGKPFQFLAQINFEDSKDLFTDTLPGNIASVLVSNADWYLDGEVQLFWSTGNEQPADCQHIPIAIGKAGPFFGCIYRMRESIADPFLGLKIGGVSRPLGRFELTPQGGFQPIPINPESGQFAFQISSILAQPSLQFPFANLKEPLEMGFDDNSVHDALRSVVFCDMGSFSFWIDGQGDFSYEFVAS